MSCGAGYCQIGSCAGCSSGCPSIPQFDGCAFKCGTMDVQSTLLYVWNQEYDPIKKYQPIVSVYLGNFDTNLGQVYIDLSQLTNVPPITITTPFIRLNVPVSRTAGAYLPPRDPVPTLVSAFRAMSDYVLQVKIGYQLTPSLPPNVLTAFIQVDFPADEQTYVLVGPLIRTTLCSQAFPLNPQPVPQ